MHENERGQSPEDDARLRTQQRGFRKMPLLARLAWVVTALLLLLSLAAMLSLAFMR